MPNRVLIIDDDADFVSVLTRRLCSKGAEVFSAENSRKGLEMIRRERPDVVLLDAILPDISGLDLVSEIKKIDEGMPVIMVSGHGEVQLVVSAMQAGASDYVEKPIDAKSLWQKIVQQIEIRRTRTAEQEVSVDGQIMGTSLRTRQMVRELGKVAASDSPVLLRGESGTGKTLIAEVIHRHSQRRDKPFVTINCPAIPESLLESELFGHEQGAFTGAVRRKVGKFEMAEGGTIFLDEIGDLFPDLQAKLLRILQNGEFERVGGLKTIRVNVRIIAATNRDLDRAIKERHFREDLFYRLNVLPIYVPSLRERVEDIPLLARFFLEESSCRANKHFEPLSEDVMDLLCGYGWPGNVRELNNLIERAVVLGKEPRLKASDFAFSTEARAAPDAARMPAESAVEAPVEKVSSLKEIEYRSLMKALEKTSGNVSRAAGELGVGRDTVYRWMKKYGILSKRS